MDVKELIEWTEHYFKHKDIFEQKLQNINKKGNSIIFEYKDRKDNAIVYLDLNEQAIQDINNIDEEFTKIFIVCGRLNKNINFLITNWKQLLIKKLTMIFVDTSLNTRVLLKPYVHNMVCDPDKLDSGIKCLFNN